MAIVVSVRFKEVGKIYYFDPNGLTFNIGEAAIVETSRGTEYGDVLVANKTVTADKVVLPLKKVLRKATPEDKTKLRENEAIAEGAKATFKASFIVCTVTFSPCSFKLVTRLRTDCTPFASNFALEGLRYRPSFSGSTSTISVPWWYAVLAP